MIFNVIIFIASCFMLSWLSSHLVKTLVAIAKFLHWREFVTAFFIMAFATSLPNLFVDVSAAFNKMPELAFGDIIGGNLVDLTIVMALAVLFGKKNLPVESKMVQTSAIFATVIVILPLLLILDGNMNRIDGIILLLAFVIYSFWLFSKGDRFKKVYREKKKEKPRNLALFLKDLIKIIVIVILLLVSSFLIIDSAKLFSVKLGIPISLVGILIVGLGNCFPEAYFSIASARKGEGWMVLGDIMGSVIICATLVLGIVALISPFEINDFSPFLIARAFAIIAAFVFLFAIKTDKKITKKEALVLLFIYISFLLLEIFKPYFL
jgi:cation:H+ antiporter